ncbi:MAG: type IV pilin protein [Casimicrobiaceae bacterium]
MPAPCGSASTAPCAAWRCRGFTAIEMMIVVAIVGILAMIALPSYLAYIERGKVSEVTSVLGGGRVLAEQYYNDNLTYVGSPCPASTKYFTIACATTATTYTFTATGTGDMSSFVYTINESNLRTTAGPWGSGNCWIFRQGDSC